VSLPITQAQLQSLRLKYNTAYTAYRSCVEALSRTSVDGGTPSRDLLEKEAYALRNLTDARTNLLAAMRDSTRLRERERAEVDSL
jgi:hypothetical protein